MNAMEFLIERQKKIYWEFTSDPDYIAEGMEEYAKIKTAELEARIKELEEKAEKRLIEELAWRGYERR